MSLNPNQMKAESNQMYMINQDKQNSLDAFDL